MKYTYAIYFLRNKSKWAVLAKLICFAIKRPYSHVEIACIPEIETMPVRFYGAVYPVSRLASARYIEERYEVVRVLPLKDFKNLGDIENIKWLDNMCGKPYSQLQIFVLAFGCLSFWLKRVLSRTQLNYDHLLICTEWGARFMGERLGYKFETQYDACQFEDILNAKGA